MLNCKWSVSFQRSSFPPMGEMSAGPLQCPPQQPGQDFARLRRAGRSRGQNRRELTYRLLKKWHFRCDPQVEQGRDRGEGHEVHHKPAKVETKCLIGLSMLLVLTFCRSLQKVKNRPKAKEKNSAGEEAEPKLTRVDQSGVRP